MAIEAYERSLEDLVRMLPESIWVSGPEVVDAVTGWISGGWRRWGARLRRRPRQLLLRAKVADMLQKRARARLEMGGGTIC